MSSSEDIAAAVIQPTKATRHNADGAFDAVPASESLYSSTRDPNYHYRSGDFNHTWSPVPPFEEDHEKRNLHRQSH
jgi:hypothetical protein